MKIAKKLVDVAVEAGADAVKFQTFSSENLVTKKVPKAKYQEESLEGSKTQFQMLKKLELGYNDFKLLKKYCDEKNIIFLSTPHTEDAIDFLDPLVPAFKIGSGDLTNIQFLKKVAKRGKPIILSTGMATMEEVKEALDAIYGEGNRKVVVLHCTTNYPCHRNEVNLRAMQAMRKDLGCLVGYSDHTLGIDVSQMAVNLGASVIEKHFTLDKSMDGPDHKASLESKELTNMIIAIRDGSYKKVGLDEEVLGLSEKKPNADEMENAKVVRKSIVAARHIRKGEKLSFENLTIKRPGTGIKPKYIESILGKKAKRAIAADSLINKEDIE